jgi:saccharopine dehydrogenase-like NADP-dependent oxidoreductase
MKRIIVIGVGAQGSTIAKRMNEHPGVSEIICADYDRKAAEALSGSLSKAKALQLDASDVNNVIAAAKGMRSDRQRPAAGFQPAGHGSGPGG